MDSRHNKLRRNLEDDRLSSLPDDLIHIILSFIGIKYAIQTSVLSSRWRFIWTSLPYLSFSTENFSKLTNFSKFVTHVLSKRNTEIEVSSVKLGFRGKVGQVFIKKILTYAFSHHVEQMTVTCLPRLNNIEFPLSLFSSQSLKHLTMAGAGYGGNFYQSITATSTWELPALTTLYLDYIIFDGVITEKCLGIFSNCPNLKNLTLNHCTILRSENVDICHPGLTNLTLENGRVFNSVLNVATPQLKNLIVREWPRVHLLSSPLKLASLVFKGSDLLQLSSKDLRSLEKADLCIYESYYYKAYAHKIVDLLQLVCNVKFLTLNVEIIQLLYLFKELITHQPSPFANLKSIKVYPHNTSSNVDETIPIPTEVKNYLLDSSSDAAITIVSSKEMRALKNAKLAENLMAEFQVLLEQENRNILAKRAPMERGRNPSKRAKTRETEEVKIDRCQRLLKIDSYWKELNVQIKQEKTKTRYIISKLRRIEDLLTELPASKKARIEKGFARLCEEAEKVMNKRMDRMKIKCDEKLKSKAV